MTVPYTYLIGWKEHDKWYYGCRYKKDCSPNDLWIKYKTSSVYVKDFAKTHGDPDVIEIRKTFETADACKEWEAKVIERIRAAHSPRWLNRNCRGSNFGGHGGWNKGKSWSEDVLIKMRKPRSYMPPFSEEHKRKIGEKRKGNTVWLNRNHTEETKNKLRKPKEVVVCPHCQKSGGISSMKRWHFQNCKRFI